MKSYLTPESEFFSPNFTPRFSRSAFLRWFEQEVLTAFLSPTLSELGFLNDKSKLTSFEAFRKHLISVEFHLNLVSSCKTIFRKILANISLKVYPRLILKNRENLKKWVNDNLESLVQAFSDR